MNTYALQFTSASQQYASGIATNLLFSNNFTLEAWISGYVQDNNQANGSSIICSIWNDKSEENYSFLIDASGHPRIRLATGHDTDIQFIFNGVTMGLACQHLAVVINNGTVFLYSNGVLVQALSGAPNPMHFPVSNIPPFRAGAYQMQSGMASFANFTLDELRVWNGVRTPDQILQNYQREITEPEAALVGYWKLNNNYLDFSGNGNNLSPSGLPVFVTNVCFPDSTTTSTSTTTTSTSSSTTTTSTSTTTTTSTSTSSSTSTSTTSTLTSTSTTRTTTSTSTTTSTTTTLTSTSTTTSTSLTTSTTITVGLRFMVEKVR